MVPVGISRRKIQTANQDCKSIIFAKLMPPHSVKKGTKTAPKKLRLIRNLNKYILAMLDLNGIAFS
jgi:hypothetical protein